MMLLLRRTLHRLDTLLSFYRGEIISSINKTFGLVDGFLLQKATVFAIHHGFSNYLLKIFFFNNQSSQTSTITNCFSTTFAH
jgi:hypothetical protein